MKKNKKNKVDFISKENFNSSMNLFSLLAGYFLLILILFSIFQFLNIKNMLGLIQILSIIIPIIIYLFKDIDTKKSKIIVIIIYLFLLLIMPFVYNKTYDLTVDGNSYHKTAIAFIKNGWNPIYETTRQFQKNNSNVVKIDKSDKMDLWIEHYPKATWIIAAVIYNMTGNIESGKCITLILSIMLFVITYNVLRKILDKKWSTIISLITVLNPIVLVQIFTYYVDGIMGILFLMELLLLFMVKPTEKTNIVLWICLISVCTIFTNIKYTGLLCSGVIAATFYFYWLIKYRKDSDYKRIVKRITICFTIVFSIAIFLVGANSYIKNTIDHKNPLYPIVGKDKVDIITTMQPKSFGKKNMFEKYFISLLSKTENVSYGSKEPTMKLPIKVYKSEIDELYAADTRIGGFGPLYALVFILTIPVFIYSIIKILKNEKDKAQYIILPIIAILLSSLLVKEIWWARYVPQLYLFQIGTLVSLIYMRKYNKSKINNVVTLVMLAAIILNLLPFGYIKYKEVRGFKNITNDINTMKSMKDLKLKLGGMSDLYGYFYTLNDNGVKYTIKNNIEEKKLRYMYSWRIGVEINE